MTAEKESTRGTVWESRISCPVRICHPIPASPSSRTDNDVHTRTATMAMKMVSPIDGVSSRVQSPWPGVAGSGLAGSGLAGSGVVGSRSRELLEPSVIALNLIECGSERQDRRQSDRGQSQ